VWSRADTRFAESFAPDGLVWAQSERTQYANLGGETLIRLDPGTGEIVGEPIAVDEAAKAFAVDETVKRVQRAIEIHARKGFHVEHFEVKGKQPGRSGGKHKDDEE